MFIAQVDTHHFNFTAVGNTESQAKEFLMRGWRKHCEYYPAADPNHIQEDDISVVELEQGQCSRDGLVITSETESQ